MTNEEMLGVLPCKKAIPGDFACAGTNPEEIAPDTETGVAVVFGQLPMSWVIEFGTGFTLGDPGATGRENTVKSSSAACGQCRIVVTDNLSEEVKCHIRCTTGQWYVRASMDCGGCTGVGQDGWHYEDLTPIYRWHY